jgi:hypothetical protein
VTSQTVRGKIRTRQHVIADLAVNHLERHLLLCGYTGQRLQHDYGYDFTAVTYDRRGQVEGGVLFFQVKATDRLPLLKDGRTVSWPISRRDLKLWLSEAYPVVLVLYDGSRDKAYWLHVQDFFAGYPTAQLFAAGDQLNVHIPTAQRVNRRAIRQLARYKNEVQEQIQRRAGHGV